MSPTLWPNASFTDLNPSKSINKDSGSYFYPFHFVSFQIKNGDWVIWLTRHDKLKILIYRLLPSTVYFFC